MSSQQKVLKLNNGYSCPIIGLGTSGNNNEEVIYQSINHLFSHNFEYANY